MKTLTRVFESFQKSELHQLADRLVEQDPIAIEWSVAFLEIETRGIWHGRARAMMARRLKHCHLSDHQRLRLVNAILQRLASGNFLEQFRDQLKLALQLNPKRACSVANVCQSAPAAHVRRYAKWMLSRKAAISGAGPGAEPNRGGL